MTTRATKWVDELVSEWVVKTEDETQLERWQKLISVRLTLLRTQRRMTRDQIADGLRRCKTGDVLYNDKGEICFFMQWQPRAKRVWVARRLDLRKHPKQWKWMSIDSATTEQLSRTEPSTRKRAPKEIAA